MVLCGAPQCSLRVTVHDPPSSQGRPGPAGNSSKVLKPPDQKNIRNCFSRKKNTRPLFETTRPLFHPLQKMFNEDFWMCKLNHFALNVSHRHLTNVVNAKKSHSKHYCAKRSFRPWAPENLLSVRVFVCVPENN